MTLIRHDAHGQVAEVFVSVQQAIGRRGEATDGDGETVFFLCGSLRFKSDAGAHEFLCSCFWPELASESSTVKYLM